jgi:hypothetical protein
MIETLKTVERKARKNHVCDLCNNDINKGEIYIHQTNKYDGSVYDFKMHEKCRFILNALWNYADPDDEGMSAEYFQETVDTYCFNYVCPHCNQDIKDVDDGCLDNKCGMDCIEKVYDRLQKYSLKRVKKEGDWMYKFVEVENE